MCAKKSGGSTRPAISRKVAIVPDQHDTSEDDRRVGTGAIPADTKPVTIHGLNAELCVETLVNERVVGFV